MIFLMVIVPQEANDVTRRLYQADNREDWSADVYSVPATPGKDEPNSSESQPEVEINVGEFVTWFIRFAAIGYFAAVCYGLWTDTEIRLHLLHISARLLQSTARTVGGWGLQAENLYGEFVDSLH